MKLIKEENERRITFIGLVHSNEDYGEKREANRKKKENIGQKGNRSADKKEGREPKNQTRPKHNSGHIKPHGIDK